MESTPGWDFVADDSAALVVTWLVPISGEFSHPWCHTRRAKIAFVGEMRRLEIQTMGASGQAATAHSYCRSLQGMSDAGADDIVSLPGRLRSLRAREATDDQPIILQGASFEELVSLFIVNSITTLRARSEKKTKHGRPWPTMVRL